MKRLRALAIAVGIALGLTAQNAYATDTQPPHVGIYLGSTFRTTVTVDCVDGFKTVHTALYDDHFTPATLNQPELVKIYRVVGSPGIDFANWQEVWGGVNGTVIQPNVAVPVNLLYGPTYMAVAVAQGDNFSNFFQKLATNPPTADNSMLFPPGTQGQDKYEYPDSPGDCPQPTTPPTTVKPTGDDNPCDGDKDDKCPTCPPPTTAPTTTHPQVQIPDTKKPTCPPTTTPPTTGSTVTTNPPTTTGTGTVTTTPPTSTGTENGGEPLTTTPVASSTPTGPQLAHTGASFVPLLLIMAVVGGSGVGMVMFARRGIKRQH